MDDNVKEHIVAVSGASGLIGRRVAALLQQRGNVSIRTLTHRNQIEIAGAISIHGDVLAKESLQQWMRGATHVVHLAGVAHTDLRSEAQRQRASDVNVRGTQNVLECALANGVERVLVASSAHVYAGQQGLNLREDSPVAGDSPYSQMKLAVEDAVDEAVNHGLRAAIARPCLTYGPRVRFNLESLMRAVRGGYYFHARGIDPLRSFASVDTVAAAMVHLLFLNGESGRFNIADRSPGRLRVWVDRLANEMGVRHPRALPISFLRGLAAAGTAAASMGLPAPFTGESLHKLTSSFTLDVSRLAATGFMWPDTQDEVIAAMVKAAV